MEQAGAQSAPGLTDLEVALRAIAHKAVDDFEKAMTAIKENHGLSRSRVETILHEAEGAIPKLHEEIEVLIQQRKKSQLEVSGGQSRQSAVQETQPAEREKQTIDSSAVGPIPDGLATQGEGVMAAAGTEKKEEEPSTVS